MKDFGLRGVKVCSRFRRTSHMKKTLINRNFQGGFKEAHPPSLDPSQNPIEQQKCEHTGSSTPVDMRFSVSVLLKPTFLEFPPCNKLSTATLHILAGVCFFRLGLWQHAVGMTSDKTYCYSLSEVCSDSCFSETWMPGFLEPSSMCCVCCRSEVVFPVLRVV